MTLSFIRGWLWRPFLMSLAVLVAACERKGQATGGEGLPPVIKIGVYMPMTGDTATFGTSSMGGIRLATEERNAAGGIRGSRIELILEDDRGQPEEAKTVVTRLVTRDKVVAVLGEVGSARSIVAAAVCQQKGVPMLTPSSTNEKVTRKGDYIFRVCFIDPFQGEAAAKFAATVLKFTRAAIITDVKNDYSVGLTKSFRESFTRLGGMIVIEKNYQAGDASFNAQLTSIREAGVDFVYAPGYYGDVGQIIKQARELGLRVPFIGGDGWDSPDLWRGGKEALNGCFITNHYSVDNPDPRVQAFIAAYRRRYGDTPDALAALAYDGARVLYDAIERANSTDGARIRDALAATRDFPGVTGTITLDANRNAVKPAVILELRDGAYHYRTTIAPS
ncbi:MAG: ABC transporter substrate-binding protein [Chloracidobacterium sp.]|nr:ABC transporter substrate-binding protein [Chloracidobacterium sp.]MDW8217469.1 ABC transporter substrate-binding protein [Acidobacteriota bacterium]